METFSDIYLLSVVCYSDTIFTPSSDSNINELREKIISFNLTDCNDVISQDCIQMSSDNNTILFTPSSIMITLDLVNSRFVNHLPIIFIVLGSIGFIGDAFTFLQRNLRHNSFCIYSLARSTIDVSNLYINLLPNYVYATDNLLSIIVGTQSCRWKLFGLVAIPQLSMNLLILSLIDRYSCTCPLASPIRKIRQLKYLPYLMLLTMAISSVMSLYSPLLYDYTPVHGCSPTDFLLNGLLYVVIHGLLTPLLMFIFVWLTYRNVHQSRQRVVSKCSFARLSFDK